MYCENLFLNFPNAGKFSLSFVIDFLYERNTIISGLSKYLYLLFGQVFSQHQWLYYVIFRKVCIQKLLDTRLFIWIQLINGVVQVFCISTDFLSYYLFYWLLWNMFAIPLLGWEFVILYNFPFYSIGFSFIYIKTI